jgi:hypothetical protein
VLGRWSKPHVATLPQTALDDLKRLLLNGTLMFDVMLSNLKEIADAMANELLEYFEDFEAARTFAEMLLLPHHHHHEKKTKKSLSGSNLLSVVGSNPLDLHKGTGFLTTGASGSVTNMMHASASRREMVSLLTAASSSMQQGGLGGGGDVAISIMNESIQNLTAGSSTLNMVAKQQQPGSNSNGPMRYQYSFTDSIALEDFASTGDFKENVKFKKKVHRRAEGASVLVMPVDFVSKTKLVFLRLEAAIELPSFLEVKLRSRFLTVIVGPASKHVQLYEVGRALATCQADDVCRELFYSARSREHILASLDHFNRGTMLIPPGEWNPKIRIEPPEKFLSKVNTLNFHIEEIFLIKNFTIRLFNRKIERK